MRDPRRIVRSPVRQSPRRSLSSRSARSLALAPLPSPPPNAAVAFPLDSVRFAIHRHSAFGRPAVPTRRRLRHVTSRRVLSLGCGFAVRRPPSAVAAIHAIHALAARPRQRPILGRRPRRTASGSCHRAPDRSLVLRSVPPSNRIVRARVSAQPSVVRVVRRRRPASRPSHFGR